MLAPVKDGVGLDGIAFGSDGNLYDNDGCGIGVSYSFGND
jgi:hypothetical protein